MKKGLRIARIFGITIKIDWSWLLILILTVWNLSSMFSQIHPEWPLWQVILIAVIAALLFFLSVLTHEMAHSLTAKKQGIPVRSITLFLFGGVSNIREEPKSPGSEFLMAILGPVTSLLIGIMLILAAGIGLQAGQFANLEPMQYLQGLNIPRTLAVWLGSINIILGVFNLIPGFPLDGGRVLRSIFWAVTKDLQKATCWASIIGQIIAWGMITAGVAMVFGVQIPFLGQGLSNGVWIIFIGWFLNNAATRGYRQMMLRDALEDVPVRQLMKKDPPTVPTDISIDTLIEDYIMQTEDHAFPVLENGRLAGIVCLEDVRKVAKGERQNQLVHEIMTPQDEIVSIHPSEDAYQALQLLAEKDIRQLVVMDAGTMSGLVRRRDIVRFLRINTEAMSA